MSLPRLACFRSAAWAAVHLGNDLSEGFAGHCFAALIQANHIVLQAVSISITYSLQLHKRSAELIPGV